MKKLFSLFIVLGGLWCAPANPQANNPPPPFVMGNNRISNFVRKAIAQRSEEMAAAGEKMPADKYGFEAPPDNVTFGYLIIHIADGNYLFCSFIGGIQAPQLSQLSETDPKQSLLDRMKASFDYCTSALAKLDDSRMSEVLSIGDTKMSRSMAILTLTGTWATHYELQEKYLQLNDVH